MIHYFTKCAVTVPGKSMRNIWWSSSEFFPSSHTPAVSRVAHTEEPGRRNRTGPARTHVSNKKQKILVTLSSSKANFCYSASPTTNSYLGLSISINSKLLSLSLSQQPTLLSLSQQQSCMTVSHKISCLCLSSTSKLSWLIPSFNRRLLWLSVSLSSTHSRDSDTVNSQ